MNIVNLDFLRREEQLAIALKALYKSYGFKEFKLSSFDEYSLYADNQSFIGGKDVISFSAGGKLLALRPDVTLSIIKNGRFEAITEKLFYDEKVYRKTARGGFAEVSQIGVEIIGEVDAVSEAELCALMLKTLGEVGEDFVLEASHVGVIVKILESLSLTGDDKIYALDCLESKNVHDFLRFASDKGLDGKYVKAFEKLITLPADLTKAKAELKEINKIINISKEIEEINALTEYTGMAISVDFSIGGDADYYNGVVFKGYVKGIPHAVLSGGRYDKLLSKFGKKQKAMGFALYLGELCKYCEDKPTQPDAALVYGNADCASALKKAENLRKNGVKVLLSKTVPQGFNGKIYYAEDIND